MSASNSCDPSSSSSGIFNRSTENENEIYTRKESEKKDVKLSRGKKKNLEGNLYLSPWDFRWSLPVSASLGSQNGHKENKAKVVLIGKGCIIYFLGDIGLCIK